LRYAYFFEREHAQSHLSLGEWEAALAAVAGVRRVSGPLDGLGDWIGYLVSPHASGGHFHDLPDRNHDAEVFFPASGRWRRAFYWHARPEPGRGVVTFEAPPGDVEPDEYPVWIAARALAARMKADLVGQDDTAYDS
jgi:hypothetical protein